MKEIQEQYKERLTIISLSSDTKSRWKAASAKHEMTWQNLNDLKLQKQHEAKVAQEQYEAAVELGKVVETQKVVIKVKCGDGGRLFGTVSTKEISAAAKEQIKLELDKKKMQLADPIKALGTYEIPVKLHPKVTTKLTVQVVEA